MQKRIILIFMTLVFEVINIFSQVKITGQLTDEKSIPIEFANVVLQSDDQLYGTTSDIHGKFELQATPGNYAFKISMIGYESYQRELLLQSELHLEAIVLKELSVEINEVIIKAQRVVRTPDRFIVNIAGDPTVFGKTGAELLNLSPGVLLQEQNGAISINGKSGTKVMVNERLLQETGIDLIRYLQTLKAEDIVRIEVLPDAGAAYDADITGGIIKITLNPQINLKKTV